METVSVVINNKPVDIPAPDDEEKYLEKLIFGDADGFANNLKNIDNLYKYEDDDDDDDTNLNDKSNPFNFSDSEDDEFLDSMGNKQEYGFNEIDNDSDNSEDDSNKIENLNDDELFFNDSDAMELDSNSDNEGSNNENSDDDEDIDNDVWNDSDDEKLVIDINSFDRLRKLRQSEDERFISGLDYISRLKKQYKSTFEIPNWSKHKYEDDLNNKDSNNDSDNEGDNETGNTKIFDKVGSSKSKLILASSNPLMDFLSKNQTYNITNDESKLLNPEFLNISRLTDANISKLSKSSIQSLSFHPTQPLLLTGGFDRTLRLYHIDGKNNNLITSLHLKQSPIQTCKIIKDNETGLTNILSGGRRKYMFKWNIDMGLIEKITRMYGNENKQKSFEYFKISNNGKIIALAGNSGWVNLLSVKTGQWLNGFKIEGLLIDFEFSINDDILIIINQSGEIWEFNIKNNKIQNRWNDITGIGITKISISKNNRFLAIGSNTGFVNIYDRLKENKLINSIDNLTTTISSLEFSYDSQVLCIASRAQRDALRLVHLPSCKVFKNWPTNVTPLGKVTSVAFSPIGGYLATGNEQGRVRLWRLLDI